MESRVVHDQAVQTGCEQARPDGGETSWGAGVPAKAPPSTKKNNATMEFPVDLDVTPFFWQDTQARKMRGRRTMSKMLRFGVGLRIFVPEQTGTIHPTPTRSILLIVLLPLLFRTSGACQKSGVASSSTGNSTGAFFLFRAWRRFSWHTNNPDGFTSMMRHISCLVRILFGGVCRRRQLSVPATVANSVRRTRTRVASLIVVNFVRRDQRLFRHEVIQARIYVGPSRFPGGIVSIV